MGIISPIWVARFFGATLCVLIFKDNEKEAQTLLRAGLGIVGPKVNWLKRTYRSQLASSMICSASIWEFFQTPVSVLLSCVYYLPRIRREVDLCFGQSTRLHLCWLPATLIYPVAAGLSFPCLAVVSQALWLRKT